jgi:hypothetical protein
VSAKTDIRYRKATSDKDSPAKEEHLGQNNRGWPTCKDNILMHTLVSSVYLKTINLKVVLYAVLQNEWICVIESLFLASLDLPNFLIGTIYCRSRGSSVSIVSDYGLNDRCSIPDRGSVFFLQPLRPDRLWGPPSLLYNGYRGSFPRG